MGVYSVDAAGPRCPCGASFEPTQGRGRPRRYCRDCAADKATLAKAWRLAHPDRVEARNAARRQGGGWGWHHVERASGDERVVRLAVAMARPAA